MYAKVSHTPSTMGKLGGKSNVKKNGKEHMSKIGKSGAKKRWAKK